jgi:hypothetical protein
MSKKRSFGSSSGGRLPCGNLTDTQYQLLDELFNRHLSPICQAAVIAKKPNPSSSFVSLSTTTTATTNASSITSSIEEVEQSQDKILKEINFILGDQIKALDHSFDLLDDNNHSIRCIQSASALIPSRRFWIVPGSSNNEYICMNSFCPCVSYIEQRYLFMYISFYLLSTIVTINIIPFILKERIVRMKISYVNIF